MINDFSSPRVLTELPSLPLSDWMTWRTLHPPPNTKIKSNGIVPWVSDLIAFRSRLLRPHRRGGWWWDVKLLLRNAVELYSIHHAHYIRCIYVFHNEDLFMLPSAVKKVFLVAYWPMMNYIRASESFGHNLHFPWPLPSQSDDGASSNSHTKCFKRHCAHCPRLLQINSRPEWKCCTLN